MQRSKIPVASIQTTAHDRDGFEAAWPRIVSLVERAAADGARLIVLPEATVPAYVLGTEPVDPAQLAAATATLGACAKRHAATIVYGAAKIASGVTYNAAIAIGPSGDEIGFAAKQFLWHFDRLWFAPGATLDPIETPLGPLGLLVCADGRIPSIAATLVDRGARMLVMPTAWVTSGRDPGARENIQADLFINVRARENGVPFVAANKCGTERESVAYCGKSSLVDSSGHIVARASECDEEILIDDLEFGSARPVAREPYEPPPIASGVERTQRARIAVTSVERTEHLARLAPLAREAGAAALLGPADAASAEPGRLFELAGIPVAAVSPATLAAPRGLVAARLAGVDLFACDARGERDLVTLARTRASELRAYVVVFESDGRAFVVDPDGVVIAGTFGDYRLAAFAYDRARATATQVAPDTDVLEGLRIAEAIRSRALAGSAHDA